MGLELRCVMIDVEADSVSWPDFGELWLNHKKLMHFTPLSKNSNITKRKDEALFLRQDLIAGDNYVKICELKHSIEQK